MENNNKINVIKIFNSVKLETDTLDHLRSKIGTFLIDRGYRRDKYCSHPTWCNEYCKLCANDNIQYLQNNCFHVTEVPCKEADFTYCFYYDENKEILWRTHKIGNCPDTEYIIEEEEN